MSGTMLVAGISAQDQESGKPEQRLNRGGAEESNYADVFQRPHQVSDSPQPCRAAGVGYAVVAMSTELDADTALMLRVKEGDRDAFTELVERYKQPVLNLAFRTLKDAAEAEDVAQHAFLQVYKAAPRYTATAKFSTWLFTIARNLCLNEIRRRTRHPADSLDEPAPGEDDAPARQHADVRSPAPPDDLLRDELEEKVEEALAALPENQRTAILLCQRDELSYEEIAAVLGCSVSATKSLIHRGRESLKEKLKPYLRTGAWGTAKT